MYILMIAIFYIESDLEIKDAMRQTREGKKVHNPERQKAYQGRKSNEMTLEKGEEWKKEKADRQKEYRKRKLDELTTDEREEQRKWNVDQQRAYRERKLK